MNELYEIVSDLMYANVHLEFHEALTEAYSLLQNGEGGL